MGTIKKQNVLLLRCHMQQLHNGLHLSLVVKSTSMNIIIELVFFMDGLGQLNYFHLATFLLKYLYNIYLWRSRIF
jgi:hypothetical protein